LERLFEGAKISLDLGVKEEASSGIDWSLPGRRGFRGRRHPITQTLDEICDIFSRLNFEVVEGPEIELDYYNFEALNIPKDHPARDMQDTFYITDTVLLRTQTSPMQVRVMENQAPQSGSANRVATNDARIQNLVYRNGKLWATHTIFFSTPGPVGRASVQWWQLNPATAGVLQEPM
jgi:phenylalanyl-tRNA synthetase alpha subunit